MRVTLTKAKHYGELGFTINRVKLKGLTIWNITLSLWYRCYEWRIVSGDILTSTKKYV